MPLIDDTVEQSSLEMEGALSRHNTMLSGIVHTGKIVEKGPDDSKAPIDVPHVLVQVGGKTADSFTRNWMPWVTLRAGYDGEWWQPELHEQVLVVAPSGDLALGIVIGALYRASVTFDGENASGVIKRDLFPKDTDALIHQRFYKDGTHIHYDRSKHELGLEIKSSPKAEKSLNLTAIMDPEGSSEGTARLALKVGSTTEPDIALEIDTTSGKGGELQLVSKAKTTLIAGSASDPKVKVLIDASAKDEEKMVLSAGATEVTINRNKKIEFSAGSTIITINQNGAVKINADQQDLNITAKNIAIEGDVKVTGTLDVS